MKIEEGSAKKKTRINKQFSISIILALVIFMISGSTAANLFAATQSLPSCTDLTGDDHIDIATTSECAAMSGDFRSNPTMFLYDAEFEQW
jgi:hypothetical protein